MNNYKKNRIKIFSVQLVAIALLTCIDLWIKQIVIDNIPLYSDVKFIDGFLGWTYVQNTGMAWSMFDGNPKLLSVFTGLIILAILIYLAIPKKRPLAYEICIPLIVSGGLANMIDRMLRGFVVDYIKTLFINFPVFNFADCLITCAAFSFAIYLIYEIIKESKEEKIKKQEERKSE